MFIPRTGLHDENDMQRASTKKKYLTSLFVSRLLPVCAGEGNSPLGIIGLRRNCFQKKNASIEYHKFFAPFPFRPRGRDVFRVLRGSARNLTKPNPSPTPRFPERLAVPSTNSLTCLNKKHLDVVPFTGTNAREFEWPEWF